MLSSHGLKSCSSNSVNNPPERPEFVLRVSNVSKKCPELAGHSLNYRALCSQEWAKKELYTIMIYSTPSFNSEPRLFSPCIYMNKLGVMIAFFFLRCTPHRTDKLTKSSLEVQWIAAWYEKKTEGINGTPTFWKLCLGVTSDRWSPKIEKKVLFDFDWLCTFLLMHESIDLNFHFVLSLK